MADSADGGRPVRRQTRKLERPADGVNGTGYGARRAEEIVSRAFVNEDAGGTRPRRRFDLPARDDPGFDAAAAAVLLDAALSGDTESAEEATGYYWGTERLRPHVERVLIDARAAGNEALVRAAERFLR